MRHSADVHSLGEEDWTVLVDVQKENSNLTDLVTDEVACIDHHQYAGPKGCRFEDGRPEVGFLRLENANDSLLGAASDIVITIAGVNVVVSYSERDAGIKYSTRSVSPLVNAGLLVRSIVDGCGIGGGHDSMAGGFIKHDAFPPGRSVDTFTRVRAIGFVEEALSRPTS